MVTEIGKSHGIDTVTEYGGTLRYTFNHGNFAESPPETSNSNIKRKLFELYAAPRRHEKKQSYKKIPSVGKNNVFFGRIDTPSEVQSAQQTHPIANEVSIDNSSNDSAQGKHIPTFRECDAGTRRSVVGRFGNEIGVNRVFASQAFINLTPIKNKKVPWKTAAHASLALLFSLFVCVFLALFWYARYRRRLSRTRPNVYYTCIHMQERVVSRACAEAAEAAGATQKKLRRTQHTLCPS